MPPALLLSLPQSLPQATTAAPQIEAFAIAEYMVVTRLVVFSLCFLTMRLLLKLNGLRRE